MPQDCGPSGTRLKDSPFIEQLQLTDQPYINTNGGPATDLFLTVNLAELKQSGIVSSTMKSLVTASMGNTPWQSSYYTSDATTAPRVSFEWNASMDSETTFTGVRTDRYADAARSIADDLAKSILKQIEDLAGKYPALRRIAGANFTVPYQPVADFDCLKELNARRAASYCGLFTHNETFWLFQMTTNPVPQLERIVCQLEAAGWKMTDNQMTNNWNNHFQPTQRRCPAGNLPAAQQAHEFFTLGNASRSTSTSWRITGNSSRRRNARRRWKNSSPRRLPWKHCCRS